MSTSLYDSIRTDKNMFSAWRHVKRSASKSRNTKIQGQASEFEHQHQRYIKTIQAQLRERRFTFDQAEGVLKDKKQREAQGKSPRPIVVSSIKNRIVQRAILQILQPRKVIDASNPNSKYRPRIDGRLGKLNKVNQSKFGIGGLMAPYGGVKPGIMLIMDAMNSGAAYYFQSDIKAFFTKIPTEHIVSLIQQEVQEEEVCQLFRDGLQVDLVNEDELASYAQIFPSNGIGVAQGSSLSAFAGNVLLYDLDHKLNEMGITAVRYIDDIFLLGASKNDLAIAVGYAKTELEKFEFSLYPPVKGSTKAAEGECRNSFTFLGCTLQPNRCVPSSLSVKKIEADVRDILSTSKKKIKEYIGGANKFDKRNARSAVLDKIGRKLFGWQKSFSFCTDALEFRNLDRRISEQILSYEQIVGRIIKNAPQDKKMIVLGIPNTEKLFMMNTKKDNT